MSELVGRLTSPAALAGRIETGGSFPYTIGDGLKVVGGALCVDTAILTLPLPASGWADNAQTVAAAGVLADASKQAITPCPAPASWEAAGAAGVRCTAQGTDSLTFVCTTVPTEDLVYNVLVQGVAG